MSHRVFVLNGGSAVLPPGFFPLGRPPILEPVEGGTLRTDFISNVPANPLFGIEDITRFVPTPAPAATAPPASEGGPMGLGEQIGNVLNTALENAPAIIGALGRAGVIGQPTIAQFGPATPFAPPTLPGMLQPADITLPFPGPTFAPFGTTRVGRGLRLVNCPDLFHTTAAGNIVPHDGIAVGPDGRLHGFLKAKVKLTRTTRRRRRP